MIRKFKKVLIIFSIVILSTSICYANTTDMLNGINSYKNGDYEKCITIMKTLVKNDPSDVIGYYYLGLAYTKTGKEILAIQNYNKVININSNKELTTLAKQGKIKLGEKKVNTIETQIENIKEEEEEEYNPILNDGIVEERTEQNNTNPQPKTTKVIRAEDYKKTETTEAAAKVNNTNQRNEPTNDEIVNAIRTLQKAGLLQNGAMGLSGTKNNNIPIDSRTQQMNSMLMMMNNGNNNNNMMQMMPYMNNGGKVDPQIMQMMLMQQMMPNFNGNNNNNGY